MMNNHFSWRSWLTHLGNRNFSKLSESKSHSLILSRVPLAYWKFKKKKRF